MRGGVVIGPSSVELSRVLVDTLSNNRYVVNIGCQDGKTGDDPCYPLYEQGFPGLAIDAGQWPEIHENLPGKDVTKLMNTTITPLTCASLLRENGCPERPHMLKIDIDSYDRDVLASVLDAGFFPDFIQVEIQPEIPPPIVFSVLYHPLYTSKWGLGGFYGCSMSSIEVIGRTFGYIPVTLDNTSVNTHDMILLRSDLFTRTGLEKLDTQEAFQKERPRNLHFPQSGIDSRRWQDRSDHSQLLIEIFQACAFASQASFGVVLPFELGLDRQGLPNRGRHNCSKA
jgi:hypothetical protein